MKEKKKTPYIVVQSQIIQICDKNTFKAFFFTEMCFQEEHNNISEAKNSSEFTVVHGTCSSYFVMGNYDT